MWTIRRSRRPAGQFYQQGLLKWRHPPVHRQEAVRWAAAAALGDDWITSTTAGHGHTLQRRRPGADGRAIGQGQATAMRHGGQCTWPPLTWLWAPNPSSPRACGGEGESLSAAIAGSAATWRSLLRDGALGRGVHESLNLAAVWKLPVVFLCENNGYAVSTPASQSIAIRDRVAFAATYGMAGAVVDGQDVLAVHAAVLAAVQRARAGKGPSFVECQTCRFEGHYFGEPQLYRSRAEIEEARRSRDRSHALRRAMRKRGKRGGVARPRG